MRLSLGTLFLTLVVFSCPVALMGAFENPEPRRERRHFFQDEVQVVGYRNLPLAAHQLGMDFKMGAMNRDLEAPSFAPGFVYQYSHYFKDLTALNAGGMINLNAHYGAFVDHQWMVGLGKAYEPFVRVGAGAFFSPQDEFAGFIKKERYHFRLTAGFEDLFYSDRHLRSEVLVAIGTSGISFGLSFLYAFDDWSELWP